MKACGKAVLLLPLACAAAAPDDSMLEEVVVTARHVTEGVTSVPLSIDVAAAADLGPAAVRDLDSLAGRFPGLAFESLWGGHGAAVVLRGLSQPSTAGDNVGVFVDDVYQAARAAVDVDMLDLERVEVVRGPQNTLFGRSSFAGAIRMVPARPTSDDYYRLQADSGSDALAGLQAVASHPLGDGRWKSRVAARIQRSDGAFAGTDQSLGDTRRQTLALTLSRESAADADRLLRLHLRLGDTRQGHPASTTLQAEDFNCGAFDPRSGYWSYSCGQLPVPVPAMITAGLPDSRTRSAQASLRISWPLGTLRIFSFSSFYLGDATGIRDFDGGTQGFWSGVCTVDFNCTAGASQTVTRFAYPNVVSRLRQQVDDWSQELRISGQARSVAWTAGLAGSHTRTLDRGYFGADRGDLLPDERLTSIIAIDPDLTGPASQLNRALVEDARSAQLLASETSFRRESLAAFGVIDLPRAARLNMRLELRGEREIVHVDPRQSGFLPVADPDPPAGRFWAVTPRFSMDYHVTDSWYGFASIARGARSGGVNTVPGLDPEERRFGPEYNWTTEMGIRRSGQQLLRTFQLTAYHVDWRHSQIMGIATTPGIGALVTRNTAGILSRGVEASLQLRAATFLDFSLAWSLADARFRAGSDDPGSRQICGLAIQPPASSFCAFGPPRSGNGSLALVPYLDGNRTARAPRSSWTATLALQRGPWQLSVWGSNLANKRYIRVAGSRGGVFYPQMPRPLDLLHGEGRRLGLSIAFETGG